MKSLFFFSVILFTLICTSCEEYRWNIEITPSDAAIETDASRDPSGIWISRRSPVTITAHKRGYVTMTASVKGLPILTNRFKVTLTQEIFDLTIELTDGTSDLYMNGKLTGTTPLPLRLPSGEYFFVLKRSGFPDQKCYLRLYQSGTYLYRHTRDSHPFIHAGIFPTGSEPKQVIYSPDGKDILVPLLDETGFDRITAENPFERERITPPADDEKKGFAEGLFIPRKNSFFVSQMEAGLIHEYTLPDYRYKRSISTGGIFPKIMVYSPVQNILAVSNWVSGNISVIDYETGSILQRFKTDQAPRGLAFSNDESILYVCDFEGGTLSRVETRSWKTVRKMTVEKAAMRHVLLSQAGDTLWVSDMYHATVYEMDPENLSIRREYRVFSNPNTIGITPDERHLFVSCRGPNNPAEGYMAASLMNGKIIVIDLQPHKELCRLEGGNQPTGLDISPDGRWLCFSNFRDRNIEIYRIR